MSQVRHGSLRCLEALVVAAVRVPDAGGLRDEASAPLVAFLSSLLIKACAPHALRPLKLSLSLLLTCESVTWFSD